MVKGEGGGKIPVNQWSFSVTFPNPFCLTVVCIISTFPVASRTKLRKLKDNC